jgi:hypothetical protein
MRAHLNKDGRPILETAICGDCEGDAFRRIQSHMIAQQYPDYDRKARQDSPAKHCAFCGKCEKPKKRGRKRAE